MVLDETDRIVALTIASFFVLSMTLVGVNYWAVSHGRWQVEEDWKDALIEESQKDQMQFVSNTEYAPGQEGQIAVIVTSAVGNVVTFTYACNYTILYPGKSLLVSGNYTMNTSVGTYWTNFTVPDVDGVYEYSSECQKPGSVVRAGKSFHVTREGIRAVMPK